MPNRRRITPEERRTVYSLTGGKCAYCGKPLPFLDMQVDHVIPLHQGGADEAFNMLPSCRSCNHYKRGMSLEKWRSQLEAIPATLERDCYTYRQGARFGMVAPTPHKVVFYFEKIDREEAQKGEVVDPIENYQGTPLEGLDAFQRQLKRFDIPFEKTTGWRRRNMDNWISVKDRLPEVFVPVLVCRKNRQGGQIVEAGQKDVGDWWRVYGTRTKSVTHWMPMPDPPGEGDPEHEIT